jgi:hypothetical protein
VIARGTGRFLVPGPCPVRQAPLWDGRGRKIFKGLRARCGNETPARKHMRRKSSPELPFPSGRDGVDSVSDQESRARNAPSPTDPIPTAMAAVGSIHQSPNAESTMVPVSATNANIAPAAETQPSACKA